MSAFLIVYAIIASALFTLAYGLLLWGALADCAARQERDQLTSRHAGGHGSLVPPPVYGLAAERARS